MFKDNNVEEGYPRPVSDFGLPSGGVDAAFSWAHNDKTYFFKDQLYWRYDEHTRRMDPGHPAQSPPWRGVPSTLDDAMRWSDGEPGKGESLAASASPLGVWGSGGTGGACPASLATDLPRAPLAYSSGACSPLPSSLPCPRHPSSCSIFTSCCHTGALKRAGTHPKTFAPSVLPSGTLCPAYPRGSSPTRFSPSLKCPCSTPCLQ